MNDNFTVLNEIHKGLVMGMESISVVSSKVGDKNFQYDIRKDFSNDGNPEWDDEVYEE